eukprot:3058946-Pyramimonas_sp.AAC.1
MFIPDKVCSSPRLGLRPPSPDDLNPSASLAFVLYIRLVHRIHPGNCSPPSLMYSKTHLEDAC